MLFTRQREKDSKSKEIGSDGDTVFRSKELQPCKKCGEPTEYVSLAFHLHFCSDECLNLFWDDYNESTNFLKG